jgi:F-type H+-transporting ATPase subunit gamma
VATQQEIKSRISSVKNVHKITRAMEMVAAARLRRAEQRIEQLRPYADAIRRMTRRAVEAADQMPDIPLLSEHDSENRVGILVVTGDRGLAGAFNSQIIRAGSRRARELERDGKEVLWFSSGKRGESTLGFRGIDLAGSWTGFTDRPAYSDAREIAEGLITAYSDDRVDRAEIFYNGYVSAMTQHVTHEVLLPLQQAELLGDEGSDDEEGSEDGGGQTADGRGESSGGGRGSGDGRGESSGGGRGSGDGGSVDHSRSLWIYEPSPEQILERLAPDYVEISIYRALLESTASEHGARMTAMRNASNNASEMIDDLTLEANRQRQAEITQQLMEIVAGAEGI